jgi:Uma2 family endonuclease
MWVLVDWARKNPGFDVAGNEAGVILDGEVRGLDGAVFKSSGKKRSTGFRRVAPILAVEVQGEEETTESLREKAAWYLEHGAATVWLVLPAQNIVLVVSASAERRLRERDRLPAPAGLNGLTPLAAALLWRAS